MKRPDLGKMLGQLQLHQIYEGDVQGLNLSFGFRKRPSFLRSHAAIVESDNPIAQWESLQEEVLHSLGLKRKITITAYSRVEALIEFACPGDRDILLDAKEVYLRSCTLISRRWSLVVGTLSQDMSKFKDRWICFTGSAFSSLVFRCFQTHLL